MGEWFLIQWLSSADPRFRTSSGIRLQKNSVWGSTRFFMWKSLSATCGRLVVFSW